MSMTLIDILHILLGAALVAVGVCVAALAERIRGPRVSREPREPRAPRAVHSARAVIPVVEAPELLPAKPARAPRAAPKTQDTEADDVIVALVAMGYKRPIATEATWACTTAERATVESWAAAALRRCARGAMS